MTGISDPLRGTRPETSGALPRPASPSASGPDLVGRLLSDGFRAGNAQTRPADPLSGTAQPPRPVESLHPSLERVTTGEQVPARLAADLALVRDQLLHPRLTLREGLNRLWAFVGDYAEKFVALRGELPRDSSTVHLGTPPGSEPRGVLLSPEVARAFAQVLRDAGLFRLYDPATGRDGVTATLEVLAAPTVLEARSRAAAVQLVPKEGELEALPLDRPATAGPGSAQRSTHDPNLRDEAVVRHPRRSAGGGLALFLREKLWPDGEDEDARSDRLFWTAVVVLGAIAVVGGVLRWLL